MTSGLTPQIAIISRINKKFYELFKILMTALFLHNNVNKTFINCPLHHKICKNVVVQLILEHALTHSGDAIYLLDLRNESREIIEGFASNPKNCPQCLKYGVLVKFLNEKTQENFLRKTIYLKDGLRGSIPKDQYFYCYECRMISYCDGRRRKLKCLSRAARDYWSD